MDTLNISSLASYASSIASDAATEELKNKAISIHCWQLDDVEGFENSGSLTGGIQTTGNYPGKARNFFELTQDLDMSKLSVKLSKNTFAGCHSIILIWSLLYATM